MFLQCSCEASLFKYRNHIWAAFQIKDFLIVLILEMIQAIYGAGIGEEGVRTARKPSAGDASA